MPVLFQPYGILYYSMPLLIVMYYAICSQSASVRQTACAVQLSLHLQQSSDCAFCTHRVCVLWNSDCLCRQCYLAFCFPTNVDNHGKFPSQQCHIDHGVLSSTGLAFASRKSTFCEKHMMLKLLMQVYVWHMCRKWFMCVTDRAANSHALHVRLTHSGTFSRSHAQI